MSGALKPLSAVREALLARLEPVAVETLALQRALGLVLAAALAAPEDLPRSPLALRDGVAVRALDTVGAGPYAPALLPVAAPVRFGEALPPVCDAVLPADAVDRHAGTFWALGQAAPGESARLPGQDFAAGAVVAEAGERLNPLRWALALHCGIGEVEVRRPRIAVASVGGDADRSSALLAALIDSDRAVLRVGEARDADLVLLPIVLPPGLPGTALSPASGAGAGESGGRPAIFVPPRPEAALAVWLGLVRPAIARLAGARGDIVGDAGGVLAAKLVSTVGVSELSVMARRPPADGMPEWTPLACGDIPWSALAATDAAILVGPESEGAPAGSAVRGVLLW